MQALMVSRRLLYLLGILLVAACGGPEPSPLAAGQTPEARVSGYGRVLRKRSRVLVQLHVDIKIIFSFSDSQWT